MAIQGILPAKFFKSLSKAEWDQLFRNDGWLNAEQCARLWRLTDRNTPPPETMQMLVNAADLQRWLDGKVEALAKRKKP